MDEDLLERLRADLEDANYHLGAIHSLLGDAADEARLRGVFEPSRRVLREREATACATLIRLFLLGEVVSAAQVAAALPSLGVSGSRKLGLIEDVNGKGYRAAVSLNPVSLPDPGVTEADASVNWWVLSDLDDQLRRGPARSDHVMGVGGATRSLMTQAPFGTRLGSALDLGTGCGIVALWLVRAGASRVVATDISERALMFARANARLNGIPNNIDFRSGDLFAPVAGEHFDLILSNPPFVITPRGDANVPVYEYRDAGMSGDELARTVIEAGPEFLTHGGTLLCLANWEYPWGFSGLDRVRCWIERASLKAGALSAWVIERDRLDPTRYAETWVRDGGARPGDAVFDTLMASWLEDFSRRRVIAIGLGAIRIQRLVEAERSTHIRTEQVNEPFSRRPGKELSDTMSAGSVTANISDEQVLSTHWILTENVSEIREHHPGEESPRRISLHVSSPIERTVAADPLLAAAVGASDGDLSLMQIADALAELLQVEAHECAAALVEGVRELTWLGVLSPVTR